MPLHFQIYHSSIYPQHFHRTKALPKHCNASTSALWFHREYIMKANLLYISSRYHLLFFVSLKKNISRKYWNIRVFSTPLQFQLNILITKLKGLNYPSTLLHDCFHLPMLTLGQNGWELLLPYEQNDVIQTNSFHQTSFYHHNLYYGIQAFETSMEV